MDHPRFKDRKHERFEKQIYGAGDRALREERRRGRRPARAVVVRRGEVVATGTNSVTLLNDPTAHAEVSAIRAACAAVKDFKLEECEIYSSCEPCPMCLSAIYWAGIRKIYFANTREDAKRIGFDDSFIYDQIPLAPSRGRFLRGDDARRGVAGLPAVGAEGGQGRVLNLRRLPVHGVSLRHAGASGVRPSAEMVGVRAAVGTAARNTLAEVSFRGLRSAAFLVGGIWPRGKFLLSLPRCKVREVLRF